MSFDPHSTQVVAQYKALDDPITDADSAAQAANMLREKFRAVGYQMTTDPVPETPRPVTLNETRDGWRDYEPGLGLLDGHVIEWTATGEPAATDPAPVEGHLHPDGVYIAPVPADVTAAGGAVRVRHGLNGPVRVKAYADAEARTPIGYLFTQDVTPNEEHVEVVPGTVVLNVWPDPDAEV
jgi:hypothetical protein